MGWGGSYGAFFLSLWCEIACWQFHWWPISSENGEKEKVTCERMHGDEERFVAVTIEVRAPTSVTGSVTFTVFALRMNAYMYWQQINTAGGKDLYAIVETFTAISHRLETFTQLFQPPDQEQPSVGFWCIFKASMALLLWLRSRSNGHKYCSFCYQPALEQAPTNACLITSFFV